MIHVSLTIKYIGDSIMHVQHGGTKCSFEAGFGRSQKEIIISFLGEEREDIFIHSDESIDMFIPSVQGEVILCFCQSGKEIYFGTETGQLLTQGEVATMQQTFNV